MKLKWQDHELDYDNSSESVAPILEQIQKWAASDEVANYSLRIDGVNIYSDYRSILDERASEITVIELQTQSIEEFAEHLANTVSEYLARAIPQLRQLYQDLYRQATADEWDRLSDLFDGMQWLHEAATTFPDIPNSRYESLLVFRKAIDELVPEFVDAVEGRDAITIADMIQFEVSPVYLALQDGITAILNSEVVKPDVN